MGVGGSVECRDGGTGPAVTTTWSPQLCLSPKKDASPSDGCIALWGGGEERVEASNELTDALRTFEICPDLSRGKRALAFNNTRWLVGRGARALDPLATATPGDAEDCGRGFVAGGEAAGMVFARFAWCTAGALASSPPPSKQDIIFISTSPSLSLLAWLDRARSSALCVVVLLS